MTFRNSINMDMKNKLLILTILVFVLTIFTSFLSNQQVSAAQDGGRIIDNSIFLNSNSMTKEGIQSFLSGKGAGLANLSFVIDCDLAGTQAKAIYQSIGAPCGSSIPASHIIFYASQIYGINPQVILATMQKEQSLTTASNPTSWQLNQAMGYACPTSGDCESSSSFFYQIDNGTWVLRFHYERARGNNSWWYTSTSWTCGTEKNYYKPNLYPGQNVRFYDQDNVLYRTHFIANAATSSLYCYTPHTYNNPSGLFGLPAYGTTGRYYTGSYNFVRFFELWFGSTRTGICYGGNESVSVDVQFRKYDSRQDLATFMINSGSGSGCVESHIWNPGYGSWKAHIASNQPGISAGSKIEFGNIDGGETDVPILFGLQNTSTNKIESHIWARDMQRYASQSATNASLVDSTKSDIIMGDLNGDRKDEAILVLYEGTGSGMIELHGWNPNMQQWIYQIATNHPVISKNVMSVALADLDGDNDDEAILIAKNNTGSGKIEFHVWNPGQWSWQSHIASNMPQVNSENGKVVFADVDGNGTDEGVLVGLKGSGSGKIEFHVWNPGFGSWRSNHASNQPTL